jgi:hypothetical protein
MEPQDVTTLFEVLFDIRNDIRDIAALLKEDHGEEGDEEESP